MAFKKLEHLEASSSRLRLSEISGFEQKVALLASSREGYDIFASTFF